MLTHFATSLRRRILLLLTTLGSVGCVLGAEPKNLNASSNTAAAPPLLGQPLVFPSYYRDDVAFRVTVARDQLPGNDRTTLTARILVDERTVVRRETPVDRSPIEMTLALKQVPPGPYRLRIELQRAGRVLEIRTTDLQRLREKPVDSLAVHPDQNLRLVVRGKPFFPIGIYETPLTLTALDELRKAGFNTVRLSPGPSKILRSILDRFHSAGMKAWIALGHMIEIEDPASEKAERLRELITALRDHPALLVWESVDEPAWGKRNPDALLNGYRLVRKCDPDHPVWMNHAPRNTVAELARYNLAADITGCDIYPVPEPQTQSNLPNKTLSVVGDEADKNRAATGYRKPIFMVLQGFAWGRLHHRPGVYPTLDQQRFMAWDAILHGASGILYWGTPYTPKPSRAWADMKTVAGELRDLTPFILAPDLPGVRVSPPPDRSGCEARVRMVGRFPVLIVLNTKKTPADVRVRGVPRNIRSLHVLYDSRQIPVENGSVRVRLPGYGVLLAAADPGFRPARPDYSQELRNPHPEIPLKEMRTPGNLVINPSFEFTNTQDGLPLIWQARYPFSVFPETTNPHSGRCCVRFESSASDYTPLIVQTGIPVKPGAKYRLSAWYQTDGGPIECRVYVEWSVNGQFYPKVTPWQRGATGWRQLRREFTAAPPLPANNCIYVVLQTRGKGRAWFDDVAIEPVGTPKPR